MNTVLCVRAETAMQGHRRRSSRIQQRERAAFVAADLSAFFSDGLLLRLIFIRLDAADILRSQRVCHAWRVIAMEDGTWQELAARKHPAAAKQLTASSVSSAEATPSSPAADRFERLVTGLAGRVQQSEMCPADRFPWPEPNLAISDLMLVVEFYVCEPAGQRSSLGSIVVEDCRAWFAGVPAAGRNPVDGTTLWMKQPASDDGRCLSFSETNGALDCWCKPHPLSTHDYAKVSDKLCIRSHLVRKSDGRMVCLMDTTPMPDVNNEVFAQELWRDDGGGDGGGSDEALQTYYLYFFGSPIFPASDGRPAALTGWMLHGMKQFVEVDVQVQVLLCAVDCEGHASSVRGGDCHVHAIGMTWKYQGPDDDCCNQEFDESDRLLLLLESFDWR